MKWGLYTVALQEKVENKWVRMRVHIMQIIYVYSGCSPDKYKEYVESKGARIQQQAQKYNQLLMEGLVSNGAAVEAVSSRPINRSVDRRVFFKGEKETECGIDYYYVPFLNYPILRNISVLFATFFKVLFMHTKKKQRVLMCDALTIAASIGALAAAKLRGIKTVGIVTDVPCHRPDSAAPSRSEKINLWLMKRYDSYLLLTEQMSAIVNPKNRPYIVLEGHSDIAMQAVENLLADKHEKNVCLYAGSLRRVYGIEKLVKGFIAANIPDAELHIYGNGDYVEELKALVQQYDSVKYFGIAPNDAIVQAELKATLLVNPRPTNEEYTKYSFPSKNMEYMASGTPVLTTCLPGMPEDHKPYVFFIEEETEEGVREALLQVFRHSKEELHAFGERAKKFVMQEKNNCAQAYKVISFLKTKLGIDD